MPALSIWDKSDVRLIVRLFSTPSTLTLWVRQILKKKHEEYIFLPFGLTVNMCPKIEQNSKNQNTNSVQEF